MLLASSGPWHLTSRGFWLLGPDGAVLAVMGPLSFRAGMSAVGACSRPSRLPSVRQPSSTPLAFSSQPVSGGWPTPWEGERGNWEAGGWRDPCSHCALLPWADGNSTALVPRDLAVARALLHLSRVALGEPWSTLELLFFHVRRVSVQLVCSLQGVVVSDR